MAGFFDDIPTWALRSAPAPPVEDETKLRLEAAAKLEELDKQAMDEFRGVNTAAEVAPPTKRKPGRPKGAKDTKPRGRLAASNTEPTGDA